MTDTPCHPDAASYPPAPVEYQREKGHHVVSTGEGVQTAAQESAEYRRVLESIASPVVSHQGKDQIIDLYR